MTAYFLGLDVGATKTHALVADGIGHVLGFARAGPGTSSRSATPGMAVALREATAAALAMAGVAADRLAGAGFGIGGYDWPSQQPRMLETIDQALGLRAPLAIVNDAVLGLLAGTSAGWGVALVAGTSTNCRGRDPQGREGRVTGDGWRFGEYAGGGELVMKALHVVVAAWSRRGPPTRLTEALVAHAGARHVDDLIEGLALNRYRLGPAAAPLVFAWRAPATRWPRMLSPGPGRSWPAWWSGWRASSALSACVRSGPRRQRFRCRGAAARAVRATIHAGAPRARVKRLQAPPVIGAVLLGLEQAGRDPAPARRALLRNCAGLASPAALAVAPGEAETAAVSLGLPDRPAGA